ncbi:NADH dehydrogenase (quinone), G subunit [Mobiluncus mulieris FB024-16]|uniref:NADH-quinone oxidoreductase subunit G n=1 Tax=Mobiluncus mulieris TaxID=2052 RepID=UPI0001E52104|nr:NADH-quinone oxidoreductase subunit G [Mobiluncus mulieris]EFN92756.1 NADH dehydrogenase (quinone), G subunit [Mobiluncus mulieris FB024-16]NMX00550.1 NADH-quinone oxidoreductase subunit G [Mobiluncus mulieris]
MEDVQMVNIKVDGQPLEVPKGTLAIRACEQAGVYVPRFCDHPLLKPVAACRACLVEIAAPNRQGVVAKMPKPQPACSTTVTDQMEIYTQLSSEVAAKAQNGILEFILINHPLDCPVCDKAGECPLQNQAFLEGNPSSRFTDAKRVQPKPVRLTSEILLDRERCVLCQRCVRFGKEIAGDAFLDLQGRGGGSSPRDHHDFMGENIGSFDTQVLGFFDPDCNPDGHTLTPSQITGPGGQPGCLGGLHPGHVPVAEQDMSGRRFASYFSGNVTQICPVGALTNTSYRFRARPHDLISTPSITDQDASGAEIRVDARRGVVLRRLAGENPQVNEEWISDKDRYAFPWQTLRDRLTRPMIRNEAGELVETDWGTALRTAANYIKESAKDSEVGFFPGGHLTLEDYYAWGKFARVVTGSNILDARVRDFRMDEVNFIKTRVAGRPMEVTYADIDRASTVFLIDFEPEDECATLFLRLRKATQHGTKVTTLAPYLSQGARKLQATLLANRPGQQPQILKDIAAGQGDSVPLKAALSQPDALILIGERAGLVEGELEAAAALIDATGAKWAWIPRRVGERAAIEAGCFPGLLPRGRLVTDPEARADMDAAWDVKHPLTEELPLCIRCMVIPEAWEMFLPGSTLVMGGVDLRDMEDFAGIHKALAGVKHVIQLEVRKSEITSYADVVLPVAPPHEKAGTFINWEGRLRPFGQALATRALPDWKVMNLLGKAAGVDLGLDSLEAILREYESLGTWDGQRLSAPYRQDPPICEPQAGQALVATWKPLLDAGRCLDGEPDLAGSAKVPVARLSAETAAENQIGTQVRLTGPAGSITLPVVIEDMPSRVVWLPECSPGSQIHETLGVAYGHLVNLQAAEV